MQHKFIREDNTVIQNVKSMRFISQVNDGANLRFGSTVSSCIEVTAYGSISDAPADGEVITYHQVFDINNNMKPLPSGTTREFWIGDFTATPSVPSKDTYSFVAYDNIHKLDVDYSARLMQLKSSFPMLISTLLQDAASVAGVTLASTPGIIPWYDNVYVGYFYSDGITCRDIFSAVAELNATFVKCMNQNGDIGFSWYSAAMRSPVGTGNAWFDSTRYIICPTDQQTYTNQYGVTLYPAVYKENGLKTSTFSAELIGEVILRKSDGTVLQDYIPQSPEGTDVYEISNNIILDNLVELSPGDLSTVLPLRCDEILTTANNTIRSNAWRGGMRNTEVHIFPFLNPYIVGDTTTIVDTNDVKWAFPIMKMEETMSEVIFSSFTTGTMYRSTQKYQTADKSGLSLEARVGSLDDKVSTLDGLISALDSAVGALQSVSKYQVGDVITSGLRGYGRTTSDGARFYSVFPMDRPIDATSFNLTLNSGSIYTSAGQGTINTSGTITSKAIIRNLVICSIPLSNTLTGLMPGVIEISSNTFTFEFT